MSRGFDSFDIDDFRGSDSGSERGMGGGSTSSWDKWRERQNIHREEERSDALARGHLYTRQWERTKRRCEPARRAIVPKCSQVGELRKYRGSGKSVSSVS